MIKLHILELFGLVLMEIHCHTKKHMLIIIDLLVTSALFVEGIVYLTNPYDMDYIVKGKLGRGLELSSTTVSKYKLASQN